jgi:hypothetical protein
VRNISQYDYHILLNHAIQLAVGSGQFINTARCRLKYLHRMRNIIRREGKSMRNSDESGMALLMAVIALAIVAIVGFYLTLNATTQVQISDNFESQIQASYAAISGLNHAKVLLRGLAFDAVLQGPDGAYNPMPSYIKQAKTFQFRLPIPIQTAQTLDIFHPSASMLGISDDGIINTGFFEGVPGTELLPKTGIGYFSPNPYGEGQVLNARYFAKITDNNGELSELAADPQNNPFLDGDGVVIVRSVGVSKTFSNRIGSIIRKNSVAVYESRLKRLSTWNLGPALTVLGSMVTISFDGNPEISSDLSAGIGTIDVDSIDSNFPDQIIRSAVGETIIVHGKGPENPSVRDITAEITTNSDQALLLQPEYLWEFVQNQAPIMADAVYEGAPVQVEGNSPYLGTYDSSKSWNAPGQNPKLTLVKGDLYAPDGLSGGGLLIVTGQLLCSGPIAFHGLILVVGSGNLVLSGSGPGVTGGVLVASLTSSDMGISWGIPDISISGSCRIISNKEAVRTAASLIPARQISFREIAGVDP